MAHKYGKKSRNEDTERLLDQGHYVMAGYRYERYRRFAPYVRNFKAEEKRRTYTYLIKFFLFSTAMILFCVLMYIPVYNKANDQLSKGSMLLVDKPSSLENYTPVKTEPKTWFERLKELTDPMLLVDKLSSLEEYQSDRTDPNLRFERLKVLTGISGWSIKTNRDTKVYVQPNNVTTIHTPKDLCPEADKLRKNELFLLIIVCSSTENFEIRKTIRDTWADYESYKIIKEINDKVRERYKNYNFTYDLYSNNVTNKSNEQVGNVNKKIEKDISSFGRLLPELAEALQKNLDDVKPEVVKAEVEERRFDDDVLIPEFDINKEIDNQVISDYDYNYESNIMRIPPKGLEDTRNLQEVLNLLKMNNFKLKRQPDFKLAFLLGLPSEKNDTDLQEKIEEEVERYGDIIQEGFIDSYNNLTLKSIMMLKWITYNCNQSVRYILKTDDDMYINVPNLVNNLMNRSKHFDKSVEGYKRNEYLLIGSLICGARPVHNSKNKWYSPRYMYGGHIYPQYLSGTGYAMSALTAHALYEAALRIKYFHLEDIYITGMCAFRAYPHIIPKNDPNFNYFNSSRTNDVCSAHSQVTVHRIPPDRMREVHKQLQSEEVQDVCEKRRLTQIKEQREKADENHKLMDLKIEELL